MVGFISKAFGHNSWETLVEARWLRNKNNLKSYKFDPNKSQIIAVMYDGPNQGDTKGPQRQGSIRDRMQAGYERLDAADAD